jgi:hypothetical protein
MKITPQSEPSKHDQLVTGALTIEGAQPGWMTLNAARAAVFTGEIVFAIDPEVRMYLDDGVVYYADRAGDPSIGQRLLDAGLVTRAQLDRGTGEGSL